MLVAAIGDIRGNLPALESVLKTLANEGIQTIVNTGDSAVGHRSSDDVVHLLKKTKTTSVQGGLDRLLTRFSRKNRSLQNRLPEAQYHALQEAYAHCSSTTVEYLGSLPSRAKLGVDGIFLELCHGSLTSQSERLRQEDDESLFQRQREMTEAHIIVCGQGEDAFIRRVDETLFVHPGSVGMASDGRAHYAVISTENEPWDAQLHSVEYESTQKVR